MTEFNTARKQYFFSQQTLYPIDNKDGDAYERAAFYEVTSLDWNTGIDKMIRHWFYHTVGYSDAYTKNLSDLWYIYLGSKGYTGSLRGRLKKFYEDKTISISAP